MLLFTRERPETSVELSSSSSPLCISEGEIFPICWLLFLSLVADVMSHDYHFECGEM
jgi:hypothetical protein